MGDRAERLLARLEEGNERFARTNGRGEAPPLGENHQFDLHVHNLYGDIDPSVVDVEELRRAAWRTMDTAAPNARPAHASSHLASSRGGGDDDLERALEMSRKEHLDQLGTRDAPVVIDDDDEDEQLQLAIAMSTADGPNTNAPIRAQTPEEERRMIAQAMAASMQPHETVEAETDSDAEFEATNAVLEASRKSYRDEQERDRKRRRTQDEHSLATAGPSSVAGPSRDALGAARTVAVSPSPTLASGTATPTPSDIVAAAPAPVAVSKPLGGIDRAAMEKERLARQAARQRAAAAGSNSEASSSSNVMSSAAPGASTAGASASHPFSSSAPSPGTRLRDHPLQSTGPFPRDEAGEYYLDGELRHVHLGIGNPTTESVFTARDVFAGHEHMNLLIISSYVWDHAWIEDNHILPHPGLVPTIRVTRPQTNDRNESRASSGKLQAMPNGEVWAYPEMNGWMGSEHMKFAFIFYKTGRLRVAIFTANMVDYDWDRIENTVFIQDFLPIKGKASLPRPGNLPDFPKQFRDLFVHLKIHKGIGLLALSHPFGRDIPLNGDVHFPGLAGYDWSRVIVRLVMSITGNYEGQQQMARYGICRLGNVLAEEGWVPGSNERLVAEYQGSSCGLYTPNWLNTFYRVISGIDLATIAGMREVTTWDPTPPIKVVFPSLATVDNSIGGRPGGGTMFCGKTWAKTPAARPLFHDANSKRGGVMMHSKMLIGLFEPPPQTLGDKVSTNKNGKRPGDDTLEELSKVGGWVYVGSHNFSKAAWGTVTFNKKTKLPKLSISNYELGIVFPLSRDDANVMANKVAPHKRPARPYGSTDMPWDQDLPDRR